MNTPLRLAIFATGLLAAFVAAWGAGMAVGPILDEPVGYFDFQHDGVVRTAEFFVTASTQAGGEHDDH